MASKLSLDHIPAPAWFVEITAKPPPRSKNPSIPDPPGFSSQKRLPPSKQSAQPTTTTTTTTARKPPTPAETDTLKLKKAWELALAPAKALPMNAIMMYMSGNTLQIFSIMMVFMLFKNPAQGLLATNQLFARFETDGTRAKMWMVKIVYVLLQLLALGLGIWKVNGMGLFPTTRSDWLAWEKERVPLERAIFAW